MKIIKKGMAGTLESSDVLVVISPNNDIGLKLVLQSKVEKQFGSAIRMCVKNTLAMCGVSDAVIEVRDQGALECVIKARVEAAAYRAAGETNSRFEVPS
ncbi:citrate lyase acyl carrier protein [Acetobacter sacchari]|uniref:Citrate lyase acyl carrier protein n=1 Tax=Acetobacter sacchari TaxID=2661687 RepID=A0ABS3M0K5_9PROT|nr:citrate lyase acyl carrier protein [Acetobacter sacchari]MBO1361675.1 citrate lyase acyl carrier protein [Acetobacter sacchari]